MNNTYVFRDDFIIEQMERGAGFSFALTFNRNLWTKEEAEELAKKFNGMVMDYWRCRPGSKEPSYGTESS